MRYNYRSSGILSKPIFEHKDETIASQSNRNCRYEYKQALTQRIEEANYGTIGTYGSEGIGSNTTDGRGGILIVGEAGRKSIDGSAVCSHVIADTTIYGGVYSSVGTFNTFLGAAECSVRVYKPVTDEPYNELDYGSITDNHTNTIDNGLVSELGAVTIERRGPVSYTHLRSPRDRG